MTQQVKNNLSHIATFLTGVVTEFLLDGAEYFYMLYTITEEQTFNPNFYRGIAYGLLGVFIRSVIKSGIKKTFNAYGLKASTVINKFFDK